MTLKLKLAAERVIVSGIAATCVVMGAECAYAKPKRLHDQAAAIVRNDGSESPNRSYQAGPHTRIYVTNRSWLDAGTEVVPGDRKFSDYAFPPGYSFARENHNRPLDRQPLNPPSDLGGYPMTIPLY